VFLVKRLQFRKGQTNTNINDLGGARDSTLKAKIHHFPLSYKPMQINHVRVSQSNCYVSGVGVTKK